MDCHSRPSPQSGATSLAHEPQPPQLSGRLLLLMAATTAVAVANLYYCQPLLADIARGFSLSQRQVARVAMVTQIGYALGLALFVPLGDLLERRALICRLLLATAVALLGVAMAPSFGVMLGCSLLVGMFAAVVQVIVPMAASLAPAAQRGHAVGVVFSGLLIGVLGARTISGLVGGYFGWRVMYATAAGAVGLLAVLLRFWLPLNRPKVHLDYLELIESGATAGAEMRAFAGGGILRSLRLCCAQCVLDHAGVFSRPAALSLRREDGWYARSGGYRRRRGCATGGPQRRPARTTLHDWRSPDPGLLLIPDPFFVGRANGGPVGWNRGAGLGGTNQPGFEPSCHLCRCS